MLADFRFSQDENDDAMPLRPRTKVLVGVQATAALITSVHVIARGVSLLGQ